MINGPTVHSKLRADNGRVNQLIAAQKPDDEIISTLYMAGVCRTPTTDELKTAKALLPLRAKRTVGRRWRTLAGRF